MVMLMDNGLPLSTTPEIDAALSADAVVAVGVSGGKDSQAALIAVADHLAAIGHRGPVVLVHADLGRVEWTDSLPTCERLSDTFGWELMVVRRKAGDLLDRWTKRWTDNVARYAALECVKIISPWSSPSLRFCTSELKTDVIASALRKRFPGKAIISVAGIRAEESSARSKMPVFSPHIKLTRRDAPGLSWHPILHATKVQVLAAIAKRGLRLHQAYTEYGTSRVSCMLCIMSSMSDLNAALGAGECHALYRELCDLERRSTFSFQQGRWLTMLKPELLGEGAALRLGDTLAAVAARESAELRLPPDVLYQKGWPVAVPTHEHSQIIASVRRQVADALQLQIGYTTAGEVRDRIAGLYDVRQQRVAARAH